MMAVKDWSRSTRSKECTRGAAPSICGPFRVLGAAFALFLVSAAGFGQTLSKDPTAGAAANSPHSALMVIKTDETVPGPVEDLIESGNRLSNSERYDEAIIEYERALEKAKKPVYVIWIDLGNAYLRKTDYAKALEYFDKAIAMKPGEPTGHLGSAEASYDSGKFPDAEREYRKVIELSPGGVNSRVHHFLAVTLYAEHRLDDAIAEFKIAIGQARGVYAEAHYDLGVSYMDERKDADAEQEFRTAIEQDRGRNADDYYNLGVILEREHRAEEAADAYSRYLEIAKDPPDTESLKARIARLRRH